MPNSLGRQMNGYRHTMQADLHRGADRPNNHRAHRVVDGLVSQTDQRFGRHIDVACAMRVATTSGIEETSRALTEGGGDEGGGRKTITARVSPLHGAGVSG